MEKRLIKPEILNNEVSSKYIFVEPCTTVFGNDTYFCSCGSVNEKKPENNFEIEISYEDYMNLDYVDLSKISKRANIQCPKCEKDYTKSEVYNNIKNINQKFLEKFDLEDTEEFLSIYKYRFWASKKNEENQGISVNNEHSAIRISKKEKPSAIEFKPYDSDSFRSLDLGEIVESVQGFFSVDHEVEVAEGFISVHDFVGRMGTLVSDADNIDIVKDLLGEVRFSTGLEPLKKIICAFLGIITYSNLSTIALTKGTRFLFDMMENCPLPSIQFMEKSGATSPLRIFNYLINLKNKQIQNDLTATI